MYFITKGVKMNVLKIVIFSTLFLSTIGCNSYDMNPAEVKNTSQEEMDSYSYPKVFVSKHNYKNIKKYSWSSHGFINKLHNNCKENNQLFDRT